MADVVLKAIATFIDFEGEQSNIIGWVKVADTATLAAASTAVSTWATNAAALSNAKLKSYGVQLDTISDLTLPAIAGHYPNIEDKLFIEFQSSATGQQYKTNIPAPKDTCFGTDQETISWSGAGVTTFTGGVEVNMVTNSGGGSLKKIKGFFRRSKMRKRLRSGIPSEMGG